MYEKFEEYYRSEADYLRRLAEQNFTKQARPPQKRKDWEAQEATKPQPPVGPKQQRQYVNQIDQPGEDMHQFTKNQPQCGRTPSA